jgi:predicted trehalose synthase
MLNNANRHGRLNLASVQACINARSEDFIDAAKSIHELGYELNNRPRVNVPIAGILETLKSSGGY